MPSQAAGFTSPEPWVDDAEMVLTLFCSDGRFCSHHLSLFSHLGLTRYHPIAMPGGPGIVVQASYTFINDRQRLELMLVKKHIRRVIAIAHQDCLYYKLRYPDLDPQAIRALQEKDLYECAEVVRRLSPDVNVELGYAEIVNNRVRFVPLGTDWLSYLNSERNETPPTRQTPPQEIISSLRGNEQSSERFTPERGRKR